MMGSRNHSRLWLGGVFAMLALAACAGPKTSQPRVAVEQLPTYEAAPRRAPPPTVRVAPQIAQPPKLSQQRGALIDPVFAPEAPQVAQRAPAPLRQPRVAKRALEDIAVLPQRRVEAPPSTPRVVAPPRIAAPAIPAPSAPPPQRAQIAAQPSPSAPSLIIAGTGAGLDEAAQAALPEGPPRRYRPAQGVSADYASLGRRRAAAPRGRGGVQVAEIGRPRFPDFYGELPQTDADPALNASQFQTPEAAQDDAAPAPNTSQQSASPLGQPQQPFAFEDPQFAQPPAQPEPAPQQPAYQPYAGNEGDAYPGAAAIAPAQPAPQPQPAGGFGPVSGPVTIALLTPGSDSRPSVQRLAKGISRAAALAAKEHGDRELVLRGYDTRGTPEGAAEAARKAIADGARLILGPLFSGSAAAVAPIAAQAQVSVIAFTTDSGVLSRGVYSIGFLPQTEIDRIVGFAAQRGLRNMAVLAPDSPYGAIVYNEVQGASGRHAMRIERIQPFQTSFEAMDATAQDFARFYQTLPKTSADPEAPPELGGLLLAASGRSLQALAAYLAYHDVLPANVKFMGLGPWDDDETFREATLRDGWFPAPDPGPRAAFDQRYKTAFGDEPPAIGVLGHDAVQVAIALLQDARRGAQFAFGPESIERDGGFVGASGKFRFRANGANERLLSILTVGRREFVVLEPAPQGFVDKFSALGGNAQ